MIPLWLFRNDPSYDGVEPAIVHWLDHPAEYTSVVIHVLDSGEMPSLYRPGCDVAPTPLPIRDVFRRQFVWAVWRQDFAAVQWKAVVYFAEDTRVRRCWGTRVRPYPGSSEAFV